ncbi:hypothetical protein A3K55_00650 [Candidatus Shapirobacteria bacterium RBG_13_44_7]|uniref:Uncharacterized protein n=1 Tax=Candidatus Shapirobacteria bacterium RBG_13_44_7 TaxID=1802149 RepID=A0A1F7SGA7_9BACT|nr:MAG: hypothetical protein A3K55_00650 [Candidatus Shapirobacteria bacterium RBG_13_44_7]
MDDNQKLTSELQKLNQKLDTIGNHSRYLVYNANPFKFALFNFIAGMFHALGNLFVTVVLAALAVYLLSSLNFNQIINNWLQNLVKQVTIENFLPSQP